MAPSPQTIARAGSDPTPVTARQETVLIYAADADRAANVADIVRSAGWLPIITNTVDDAVLSMDDAPPDVLVLAVANSSGNELELLDRARDGQDTEQIPIVCLLERKHRHLVLDAFGRRADDVISGHLHPSELIARLRTRIERPPVPRSRLLEDPVTGALTSEAFEDQLRKEHERVYRGANQGRWRSSQSTSYPNLQRATDREHVTSCSHRSSD